MGASEKGARTSVRVYFQKDLIMSWVSEQSKKIAPVFGAAFPVFSLGTGGALAGGASTMTLAPLTAEAFGEAQRNPGPGNVGSAQLSASQKRAAEIISKIQEGSGLGTYGEGSVQNTVDEFKKLRSELEAGKLSQKEFVEIGNQILPTMIEHSHKIAGAGSRAANAVKNAGMEALVNDIGRDFNIYKAAQSQLGRDLNANELAQLRPAYAGGDESGNAALAYFAEQDKLRPDYYQKQAGQFSGDVNAVFQDLLKRGASKSEIDHFGTLLASKQIDPYELQQFVREMPEFRQAEDTKFRSGLNQELANYDTEAFNKQKEGILSRYSRAGIQNSSALDFALTNLMGDIAKERQKYLAGVSTQQYGSNKDLARQDYQTTLNNYLSNRDYNRDRSNQMFDTYQGRSWEVADYNRQRNDYLNYLSSNKRSSGGKPYGQIAGTAIGSIWGPAGAQVGSGLGSSFDYLYNS